MDDSRKMAAELPRLTAVMQQLGTNRPQLLNPQQLERHFGSKKPYYVSEAGVAVIDVSGPLAKSPDFFARYFEGASSYDEITMQVEDAATDPSVKGIVLRMNTPGGETSGAFEAADVIETAAKIKPMCAVSDDSMFSAGALLGMAAGEVWVAPITGGVGSIGVIMQHVDYSGYLQKAGIKITTIARGAHKADMSPYAPLTDSAMEEANKIMDALYSAFVSATAKRRKMTAEAVMATEARLYFGAEAVATGFADRVGTLREAIAAMEARVSGNSIRFSMASAMKPTKGETSMSQIQDPAPVVVDIGAARSSGVAEGVEYAAEVAALCELAGFASMTSGFLSSKTPIKDVRAQLMAKKAESSVQIRTGVLAEETGGAKFSFASYMKQQHGGAK